MTLIVGIKCEDGVVVAADGAATLGSMGHQTARQPVRKLEIVAGASAIFALSGPVGLMQRLQAIVESSIHGKLRGKKCSQIMTELRQDFWQVVSYEMNVAKVARDLIGNVALTDVISSCVLAMPVEDAPCLFQFDQQCAPEQATANVPFVAIGSGQQTADPFLAFIRRTFWSDRLPNLAEGTFAAYWTVRHAIETMPGGVADPIQIAVLRQVDSKWRAVELRSEELQEHKEFLGAIEDHLRSFKREVQPEAAEPDPGSEIPEPPKAS